MSKFWSTLFGKKNIPEAPKNEERGPHMPPSEIPVEQTFAEKFTKQGGKFIYCEQLEDAKEAFAAIIEESSSQVRELLCFDPDIAKKLDTGITLTKTNLNAKILLCSCESMVAYDGSLVVCERQLGSNKLADLPDTLIILAGTRQFAKTVSDGLKNIKLRYAENIPLNITSIKQFKTEVTADDNYMNYGNGVKEVYLLLLEDF
ncbi:MAG: LUD domain-containing protein [Flavobacteriaceae bacterium]|nr:LUD domain-containing protein [Flavobacteriaceae bacterium]